MSAGLRLLHVLAPARFGGLERVVRNLAVGQRARGHQVRVLAILDVGDEGDHPLVHQIRADGVEVEAVGVPARAYGAERRAVRNAARQYRPDVVHTHGARVDVLDAAVARAAGFPTVSTVHGFTGGGLRNRFYEYLQRRALRRADGVVAVSARMADGLIAAGVRRERVHTLMNAWPGDVKVIERGDARARLGISDCRGPVLGWVGRLTREKGADVFIDALALLADLTPDALVVGDGPELAPLRQQAVRLGVGQQLRWAGLVHDANRLLSAFDVFVLSSRTEGTPMVLFEAIAAGVPVIVSAVGGIPDVVTPMESILVPSDDPEALAAAVRRALADPDGARLRAAAALSRLKSHFAPGPWLDRYDAIYRGVIRSDVSPRG